MQTEEFPPGDWFWFCVECGRPKCMTVGMCKCGSVKDSHSEWIDPRVLVIGDEKIV